MGESLKRLINDFAVRWSGLAPGSKLIFGALIVGAAATLIISMFLVRHVSYGVLYTGLDPDAASGIVDELRGMKTPFRLTDSGRTILVPEDNVYSVRLDLAGKGVTGGGNGGYEIFDKSRFGMTNFMQQVNYRRALEGELTRTIREMDEVMTARVHLVIPERTLFMDDTRRPTASVMLRLKPGVRLARKQIDGVTHLVAGSVEGLVSQDVNIVDYYGNLLSTNHGEGGIEAQSGARFETETSVGKYLEGKAQTLLDQVVGPGKAVVRVTAELDFERLERDEEIFDSENSAVRSEEMSEEAGGTPGEESRSSVTNYEINRTVQKVVRAPGNVKRLTVAVTVDGEWVAPEGDEEEAEPVFQSRSADELGQLGALVKNAVGLDEQRGDRFHIACVQFDHDFIAQEQAEMKKAERNMFVSAILGKVLLVVLAAAAFLVLGKILKSLSKTLSEVQPPRPEAAAQQALPGGGGTAPGTAAAGPDSGAAAIESMANRVSEMARSQPQESAALIRTMVGED